MYPATIAEQLRACGHDVASVHHPYFHHLEGAPDEDVFAAAVAERRALVTENVPDFRRLEGEALAQGESTPGLIFTTNRQFPRGNPSTVSRLVAALVHACATAGHVVSCLSQGTASFLSSPGQLRHPGET